MTAPSSSWFKKLGHHLMLSTLFLVFLDSRCTQAAPFTSMETELPNSSRSFLDSLTRRRCPSTALPAAISINKDMTGLEPVKSGHTAHESCKHVAKCDITVIPQEAIVSWYSIDRNGNERLISSKTQRDVTVDLLAKRDYSDKIFGLGVTVNRLCLDPYMPKANKKYRFKCIAKSVCDQSMAVESPIMVVRSEGHTFNAHRLQPVNQAPLITMITSSRYEYTGQLVELFCHASGTPKPTVTWTVMDEFDQNKIYPISDFSYIRVLESNDVIVDTRGIESVSLTLVCTASNEFGQDSNDATITTFETS